MKHYEVTIQTAKETIIERFCFCTNIYDLTNFVDNFMNQTHKGEIYEITQIRKLDESELNFGY